MKKKLLLFISVAISFNMMAQNRIQVPSNIRNISLKRAVHFQDDYVPAQGENPYVFTGTKSLTEYQIGPEYEIGTTWYDLQSNVTVDHRIYLYSDGTIGAVWTLGTTPTSYPERGTGYNYFDGTSWGPEPTARIEPYRTGWPSYSHLGANGEVVISHDFTSTLHILTRATKGTGAWTVASLPAPSGLVPSWPRVCVSGDTIHILASSNNAYLGQNFPLVYYRSQDAGVTWNIQAQIPAGLSPADGFTQGSGADVYSWAEPVGNTLAYIVGDGWTNLSLMKSTDGGNNWTKTIIFQHPFPDFTEATDIVGDGILNLDTPYVCDGHHAVSLDAAGNAHVAFGVMRVMNADTTDAQTSYFPAVDGLAYWKEGDPTFTGVNALNPDNLYATGKLIAWVQDRNGDGVVFDNYQSSYTFPYYGAGGLTSQPQISIDANGDMYVVYTSTCENMITGSGEYFNHIWGRKYYASIGQWGEIVELLASPDPHDYDLIEMVYPSLSKTMDNQLHIVYQLDYEPGVSLIDGEVAADMNSMIYLTVDKSDLILNRKEINLTISSVNIYPNPVANTMTVSFVKSSDVVMNIYNSLGALVMSNKFYVNKGALKDFNISNLSSGIYMVKIQTAEGTYTNNIIKN